MRGVIQGGVIVEGAELVAMEGETIAVHGVTAGAYPLDVVGSAERFVVSTAKVDTCVVEPYVACVAADPFAGPCNLVLAEAARVDSRRAWVYLDVT